jgi:hypothetical protein
MYDKSLPSSALERNAEKPTTAAATFTFPSVAWFRQLADLMNGDRTRHEHLGYIDCTACFCVVDGGPRRSAWSVQVTFEEFRAVDVRQVQDTAQPDFVLEATLATWRAMIESIAAGHGRPDLRQTLNYLSHMGAPIALRSADPLRRDLYFRYNQSLQEFFNASAGFHTEFRA